MFGTSSGYSSMAEAVGEASWQQEGYEPSHVFTSSDLAEIAHDNDGDLSSVMLVTSADAVRTAQRQQVEIDRLRRALAHILECDDDELDAYLQYAGGTDEVIAQSLGLDDGFREGGEDAHLDADYESRFDFLED